MQEAKFLILGFDGVGAEIAKNLILTGSYVTICDNQCVEQKDLYVNPFLRREDIGKKKSVCLSRLQELNPSKEVQWIEHFNITYDSETKYNTIIYCQDFQNNLDFNMLKVSQIANQNEIHFIGATQFSLLGQIFVDFGKEFIVKDQDGEKYDTNVISEIMFSKEGIFCMSRDTLDFSAGDVIQLSDVEMQDNEINKQCQDLINNQQFKVVPTASTAFQIVVEQNSDLYNLIQKESQNLQYIRGGNFIRIKIPRTMSFQSYQQQINNPTIEQNIIDFSKMEYQDKEYKLIKNYILSQEINAQDNFDKYVQLTKQYQFSPLCSIIGSWASQEALKSVTGQYCPINQFALFDCMELVDFGNNVDFNSASLQSQDTLERLFNSIKLPNNQIFTDVLKQQKAFIVGAGALGCEIIKHFALNKLDKFTVTDNDKIENSNLSRQFLFREENNQQYKSQVAVERWRQISELQDADYLTEKISEENPLSNQFWTSKTVVINALDNVNARKFVDSKCVQYNLPLLESGTLGSKANMQIVIPHLTKTYGETNDPESKSEALCTIHNTPSKMSHCIQYAQNEFKGIFENGSIELKKLQTLGPEQYFQQINQGGNKFQCIYALYSLIYPLASHQLQDSGILLYNRYFVDIIDALLQITPLDAKNQDGSLFWSGDKHPPKVIPFSNDNQYCQQFIESYESIMNQIVPNIQGTEQNDKIDKLLSSSELNKCVQDNDALTLQIIQKSYDLIKDKQINQLVFEKDLEELKHVEFLSAFSNTRAMNYHIKTVDQEEIRRIAGKITPAIVTATSAIVGHVMIEFMKIVLRQANYSKTQELSFYKSVFMNLALPMCQMVENQEKTVFQGKNNKFDLWDKFTVNKSMTIQQVIDKVKELYGSQLDAISYGVKSLFMSFMCNDTNEKLEDILNNLEIKVNPHDTIMCVCMAEEDDEYIPYMVIDGF